ncbi:MAG TPA: ferritin family protein [Anaerohalosphaeraceae bacterium]|jgi:rubrerythrin|nr:ferritin family protein [Anaerohalosphaeraceae bacterium]HRT49023.1 ferritin family protein [Anaerohalosphaeraceae bacterium]HRT85146.1 ferritin family protein [Anaerohalosphaeraceae bacterium]
MNIFEYAMQMEKDGEEFYRDLARDVQNTGVRYILTMLADEEVNHFHILHNIAQAQPDAGPTNILDRAKNVFREMKETGQTLHVDESQIELYKEAQAIEQKSIDFYSEKAREVQDPLQKKLLERLAEEEKKHYFLLENIIDFVLRPTTWLENAEFVHLEEY